LAPNTKIETNIIIQETRDSKKGEDEDVGALNPTVISYYEKHTDTE
jgi:hypothetical protein